MTLPDASPLVAEVRALLQAARATAARQVNALLVLTNYEIGRRIVLAARSAPSMAAPSCAPSRAS